MNQIYFYDTNILLSLREKIFDTEEKFYISSISLNELEHIKESSSKDEDIKYASRSLLHLLARHEDKYEIVLFKNEYLKKIAKYDLPDSPDTKIIATAKAFFEQNKIKNGVFCTKDLACRAIAKSVGLETHFEEEKDKKSYTGFLEIACDDEELAQFYSIYLPSSINYYNLYVNQYLILKDKTGKVVDKYKWSDDEGYIKINFPKFDSKTFGKITPKDVYQEIAMDSMINNQITLIGGDAGSGKSYLGLGYLFQELEKGHIDQIYIICNPVGAKGAAKLGFYPGEKFSKVLSSQVGGVLATKLGGMEYVYELLEKEKLVLLPIVDARGVQIPPYSGVEILEAQNMSRELMKLALQRMSEDTKIIIDGDFQGVQTDMAEYSGLNNGMRGVIEVFKGQDLYGQCILQKVYRSKIADIANAL